MNDLFEKNLRAAVRKGRTNDVIAMIKHQYEFKCQSFVYAGPGHQSRHECTLRYPHPIDGEHSNWGYEWEGTSRLDETGKLINAEHHGGCC